jgi:hypothetical protein
MSEEQEIQRIRGFILDNELVPEYTAVKLLYSLNSQSLLLNAIDLAKKRKEWLLSLHTVVEAKADTCISITFLKIA